MIAANKVQRGWAARTPHGKIRVDTVALFATVARRAVSADVGRSWQAMAERGWRIVRVKVEAAQ